MKICAINFRAFFNACVKRNVERWSRALLEANSVWGYVQCDQMVELKVAQIR